MPPILSPLRYPGSKRRLARHIDELISVNDLRPDLFVETFAGGASVSLQLLEKSTVQKVGLIEKDPLVAAFWSVVFSKSDVNWLIDQIRTIDISLEKWRSFKETTPKDKKFRALACLFLNRTSFSGILAQSAGPLGGYTQTSQYPIDCRFPRETLIERIHQANALRDKVEFVWQVDWVVGLRRISERQKEGKLPQQIFFYFDPPFFNKAESLYNYYFTNKDHVKLRDAIIGLNQQWVLSYDYCKQVDELYSDNAQTHIEMLYSAAQNGGQRTAREVILTNLPKLPERIKLGQVDKNQTNANANNNSRHAK